MPLIEAFPGPSGVVDSTELRRDLAGLLTLNADGSPRAGVFYGGASAIGAARAGDMRIDLRSFDAALVRNGGPLFTRNEGTDQSPVLPVPSSNQIIHVVYARQNEKDSPYGDANNTPGFGFVSSTQSASPQLADVLALLPAGALPLVSVQVPSTAVTTSSAGVVVKDIAPFTAMNGGAVPFRTLTEMSAWTTPRLGQQADVLADTDVSSNGVWRWDGAKWVNAVGDTGWITLAWAPNWSDFNPGYPALAYRKKNGSTVLSAMGKTSAGSGVGTLICTLPAGFRIGRQEVRATIGSGGACGLEIFPDGSVKAGPGGVYATWTSLGGISWIAEK